MLPPGETGAESFEMRHVGTEAAFNRGNEMLHLRVTFESKQIGNVNRTKFADAPEIVAQQVGDHKSSESSLALVCNS
jgi:hypothetical protein